MSEQAAAGVRVNVYGHGDGDGRDGACPSSTSLLTRLAETARFDLVLDIEPGDTQAEVEAAAAALGARARRAAAGGGRARSRRRRARRRRRRSPHVVLETSDEPLFVTNVDLTEARIGGLGTDVARRFLEVLAENAGLVLHVRLLERHRQRPRARGDLQGARRRAGRGMRETGGDDERQDASSAPRQRRRRSRARRTRRRSPPAASSSSRASSA